MTPQPKSAGYFFASGTDVDQAAAATVVGMLPGPFGIARRAVDRIRFDRRHNYAKLECGHWVLAITRPVYVDQEGVTHGLEEHCPGCSP